MTTGKLITLDANGDRKKVLAFLKALASEPRLNILTCLLGDRPLNNNDIADTLNISPSSVTNHIQILEQAGLIRTEVTPASHGLQKFCARTYDQIHITLPQVRSNPHESFVISMPIGGYTSFDVQSTCGLATELQLIGLLDTPASFYEPEHIYAQLIWFRKGYVEYRFPNHFPANVTPLNLEISLEICSEAPLHHNDWPSDITLWINDIEVGTWTSPADFGGERGLLTPGWWEEKDSQFGQLKIWKVSDEGTFVDGTANSSTNISDLALGEYSYIQVRIGVKPDAHNVGGINIFGEKFGNYPQAVVVTF